MKMKISLLIILTFVCGASGQTANEEAAAFNRALAAQALTPITVKQCVADLDSWYNRYDDDVKKNGTSGSDFWYEKLSTEELIRLSAETTMCIGPVMKLPGYSHLLAEERGIFTFELLVRAKTVMANHGLYHEWLLAGSK